MHEKKYCAEELAQMPACNLAETVHNKWLQASGNKNGDLNVVAVDDYVRAFPQVIAYNQYTKGGRGGFGLSREELWLCTAQRQAHRSGDPSGFNKAVMEFRVAEVFYTRVLYYKEDEVEERLHEPSTFAATNIPRVTVVQETKVDERLWHIAHTLSFNKVKTILERGIMDHAAL